MPFPLSSGRLSVSLPYSKEVLACPNFESGGCSDAEKEHYDAVVSEVSLELDSDAKRFLPVASFSMKVNDWEMVKTRTGELTAKDLDKGKQFHLAASCEDDGAFHLRPGRHKVALSMSILGMVEPLQAAKAEVELVCDSGCRQASGAPLVSLALLALLRLRRRG